MTVIENEIDKYFNNEAEEAILTSVLLDQKVIVMVADSLKEEDFLRDKNKWVWRAMYDLYISHKSVDTISLADKMREQGTLNQSGGVDFINYLVLQYVPPNLIESSVKIVKKFSLKRKLKVASKKIEDLSEHDDIEKAYGDAIACLMELQENSKENKVWERFDRAELATERYAKLKDGNTDTIISFGLKCLDNEGGMQAGNNVVIAGPSGKGKTTFATQIALNVAKKHGHVLFVSLEMAVEENLDRDIARLSGRYIKEILRGNYSEQMYGEICSAIGELSEERITYFHPPIGTVPTIYTAARRKQIQDGLSLVVIDYMQLMKDSSGGVNMDERLTNISHEVKSMARELAVPVVLISQENRRSDAPILDRARGSGTISHDCSWFLYLERDEEKTKLTVAKQRQGGAEMEVELDFDWRKQAYRELIKEI